MNRGRRLFAYARPYRRAFALSFAAAIVASVLDGFMMALLIPFLRVLFDAGGIETANGVERVIGFVAGGLLAGDRDVVLRNVVLLILATVILKNAGVYVTAFVSRRMQEQVARDLRADAFAKLLQHPLARYRDVRGGQVVSTVMADVDQAKILVSATMVATLRNAILAVVYLSILWFLSWRLTLVVLLIAPVIVLALRPILAQIRARSRATLEERGEMTAVVSETVQGARVVKAHRAERHEAGRLEEAADRHLEASIGTSRFAELASPLSETLGAGVIVLLLVAVAAGVGGLEAIRPEVFVTFVVVALRLLSPVKKLSQFPAVAEPALNAADRVFALLDVDTADTDRGPATDFARFHREIRFDRVWVAYAGDDWVLRDVSIHVGAGEVLALVGPSGAGKSTLVDLLPRFIDAQRGVVSIDGVAVNRFTRSSLRRAMGIVSQETVLFNETVRANIAYGDQADASMAAVEAAARAANAHEFIRRLPSGYETRIGERGTRLSGGERQRIAIARALLRDAPILILDEATSNLDPQTELLVQEAIERLMSDRTVIVIAHRLSTVARADRIVVLENGRVVEEGVHDHLVAAGGVYQRLHGA